MAEVGVFLLYCLDLLFQGEGFFVEVFVLLQEVVDFCFGGHDLLFEDVLYGLAISLQVLGLVDLPLQRTLHNIDLFFHYLTSRAIFDLFP